MHFGNIPNYQLRVKNMFIWLVSCEKNSPQYCQNVFFLRLWNIQAGACNGGALKQIILQILRQQPGGFSTKDSGKKM